jgi:hypothetical protein
VPAPWSRLHRVLRPPRSKSARVGNRFLGLAPHRVLRMRASTPGTAMITTASASITSCATSPGHSRQRRRARWRRRRRVRLRGLDRCLPPPTSIVVGVLGPPLVIGAAMPTASALRRTARSLPVAEPRLRLETPAALRARALLDHVRRSIPRRAPMLPLGYAITRTESFLESRPGSFLESASAEAAGLAQGRFSIARSRPDAMSPRVTAHRRRRMLISERGDDLAVELRPPRGCVALPRRSFTRGGVVRAVMRTADVAAGGGGKRYGSRQGEVHIRREHPDRTASDRATRRRMTRQGRRGPDMKRSRSGRRHDRR